MRLMKSICMSTYFITISMSLFYLPKNMTSYIQAKDPWNTGKQGKKIEMIVNAQSPATSKSSQPMRHTWLGQCCGSSRINWVLNDYISWGAYG